MNITPDPALPGGRAALVPDGDRRVRAVSGTFRNILGIVFLIFVFAVVQTYVLWRVCNTGIATAATLQHQGLPTLSALAALQENLALYRLHSYEYLFAQENEKAGKTKLLELIATQTRAEVEQLKALLPDGEGRQLAGNLEAAIENQNLEFGKVRRLVDSDFPAAMKAMDENIPPSSQRVAAAAGDLKNYGNRFSFGQAEATFASFGWIKNSALVFGVIRILMALSAFVFVLVASQRTRAQLAETLGRLDERNLELAESLSLLKATFESTADGIVAVNLAGKVISYNTRFTDLWQFPAEMLERRDSREMKLFTAGQVKDPEKFIARIAESDSHSSAELFDVVELKDGRTFERYVFPQMIDGRRAGTVVNYRDVSERRRDEVALQESKLFLRSTLDALSAHIAILDERGIILEVNRAWDDFAQANNFLGSSCGVGGNYLDVCDAATGNCAEEALSSARGIRGVIAGEREEFQLEYPCHSPSAQRWFVMRVTRFGGTGTVRVVVAHENITERKLAEIFVRESEERYRSLIENARDAIFTIAADGTFTSLNPAVAAIAQISRADWIGQPFAPMVHPDDLPLAREMFQRILQGGQVPVHELRGHPSLNRPALMEMTLSALKDDGGKITGILGIGRDITERKQLETQLFQAQKLETVGKLAGGIAHEFNSILTAIIGQSELLLGDLPPGGPLVKNATEIRKAAERAATLTRQLLAYGRKQILQPEILDLNSVLAGMDTMLRQLLGRDVDMRIVLAEGLKTVKADAGQIEQVIMNIVMNAAAAMPNGGKLTLETANVTLDQDYVSRFPELPAGEYVMLAITDTGTGMSEQVKARIFEPFFSTKEAGPGTGLGLTACYGILKQSGGHISAYSELARGTTFKMYLPQIGRLPAAPAPQIDSPDLPRGTETILLVEDDPALREMAATLLRRLGYTLFTAADGLEALTVTHRKDRGHIDLLFTDVVMPNMSGKELADRIRSLYPQTKILFTSAYTESAIVHQGMLADGVALLQKPFTPSALARRVREVLD